MTTHHAPPVDWLTERGAHPPVAYAAKWAAAATSVAGTMAALVLLVLWFDQNHGSANARDNVVMINMDPLPEAPLAIATLERAPEVAMSELPDRQQRVVLDEPLPDLPDPALAPDLPYPVAALAPQFADLPPDAEALPERVKPLPVPEEKPARQKLETQKPKTKPPQQPMRQQKAASASSKGQVKSLISQWGGQIRKRVERRKTYPRMAAGAEGIVSLRLTVTRGGTLAGVSVARSSGNAALDAAAVQAVSRAGSFPLAPKGLTDAQYSFTLAVSFKN